MTRTIRHMLTASLVAAGLFAVAPASAQPNPGLGTCGSEGIPIPINPGGGCRWQCTKTTIDAGRKDRPPRVEWHWRKVCPPKTWHAPGGKAEIKKKNVPTVKPNNPPRD